MDPRDNSIFYVGKGQGKRALSHTSEVNVLINGKMKPESDKQQKILEINNSGNETKIKIIGRFETEEEAFSVESVLIHFVYGFDMLTNIQGGHDNATIRCKGEWNNIAGIDIPHEERSGEFKSQNIRRLSISGAYDFLNKLKTDLEKDNFIWSDFSSRIYRPYNPGESNGQLGLIININNVDFIINFSSTLRPSLSLANTEQTRENINRISAHYDISEAKNTKVKINGKSEGRYRSFNPHLRFNDTNSLIKKLIGIREKIS